MSRRDRPDPLQPAERELAEALARTAPAPGPSPALDAAILAAAREAAAARGTSEGGGGADAGSGAQAAATPPSAGAASGHRRRRRGAAWLRGGALAATVVLAVGVAWQLRPQFEAAGVGELPEVEMRTEAPVPQAETRAAPPDDAGATAPAQAPAPQEAGRKPAAAPAPVVVFDEPSPVAPAPAAAAREAEAREAAAAGQDRALSERRARQLPAPKAAEAASGAADASAPPPAPPPAPPAPPAPAPSEPPRLLRAQPASDASAGRDAAVLDRIEVTGSRIAAPATRAGADADADANDDTDADHEDIWFDQPYDDVPPASVESPAVREAWLARIRELVAAERYVEARDSYAEFRRRYPDAPVPDDLRSLLGGE